MSNYGAWICSDCGQKYGKWPEGHEATFHFDKCDWCKKDNVLVTEPRDWGYPKYPYSCGM